jgi:hypothetical protein
MIESINFPAVINHGEEEMLIGRRIDGPIT